LKSSRKPQLLSDPRSAAFQHSLLNWYDTHARDLPWREDRDPYRVWLSEIMLQQTRVAAVIAHYHEFLRRFPTVQKLAAAREASVLAAWSGLGYYRRARMLHATAKVVVRKLGGKFPMTAATLLELPGVGRYTAGAIASIAFGEAVAVVDGNVERVMQRVSGHRLAGEQLWDASEQMLDRNRPGDFNQAMMELGATVCTPRSPACLTCPVIEMCATRGELTGSAKTSSQKKREIHYALVLREENGRGSKVFLIQRPRDASLMAGMWELPEIASPPPRPEQQEVPPAGFASPRNDKIRGGRGVRKTHPEPYLTLRHSITVTDYTVRVWRTKASAQARGKWLPFDRLKKVALTGLARKILRKAEVIDVAARQV
jgi:A/G-specific adenine glycosylase